MNNKYIFSGLVTLCAFAFAGCDDYLDVKPVGKMIPNEISQYENLLNNSYTIGDFLIDNSTRLSAYCMLGDNVSISENQLLYQYSPSNANVGLLAGYIFHDPIWNPESQNNSWTAGIWQAMGYFNNVIDGVSELDPESDYARGVIAQAKVGRAWLYMYGALTYGPMYDPAGENATKVLPIRTSGDPTVSNGPLRSTRDIFELVKEDLDFACQYAPVNVLNASRANRAAAYALRAEYHMFRRDWINMLADANEAWRLALESKGSVDQLIYDFEKFEYRKSSTTKPAAGVDPRYYMTLYGPDDLFNRTRNRENLLYRTTPRSSRYQQFYPSEEWMELFDHDNDLRWVLFAMMSPGYSKTVSGVKYDDGVRVSNFRADNMSTTQALTYPLLLLMKAEAEARTDNATEAMKSLNLLRKYRYLGDDTDYKGAADATSLLNEILNERRREQPMVSFQRIVDLKRYAFDNGRPWSKTEVVHKSGSREYKASINSRIFQYLPIDNGILQFNPGWEIPLNTTPWSPYDAI